MADAMQFRAWLPKCDGDGGSSECRGLGGAERGLRAQVPVRSLRSGRFKSERPGRQGRDFEKSDAPRQLHEHCRVGSEGFAAALWDAKTGLGRCPRIALRSILGYFRSFPAGRVQFVLRSWQRMEPPPTMRIIHAIALETPPGTVDQRATAAFAKPATARRPEAPATRQTLCRPRSSWGL